MRRAGIREARQNLSVLLDEVKKGRQVVITDRGKPVARLVPAEPTGGAGLPDLSRFRRQLPKLDPPLSETVLSERDDRL